MQEEKLPNNEDELAKVSGGISVREAGARGGRSTLEHQGVEIIDVPGAFSLEPKDKAEEVAVRMLEEEKGATVVCVIDSSKVERGLYLALELIERGYSVIIDLNMADVAKSVNIKIDTKRLEGIFGVPVVTTVATRGEGLKELVSRMKEAKPVEIGKVIKSVGGDKSGTHR